MRRGYTVKELKKFINSIDSKYDDMQLLVDDPDCGDNCLGSPYTTINDIYSYESSWNDGYVLNISLN